MNRKKQIEKINEYISNDAFSRYLDATVEIIKPGHSRVSLLIDERMTNFHGSTHGGVIFSISDMAFAAACNSHGQVAVALNVNINYLKPSYPGDLLVAEAIEVFNGNKTALYSVDVRNEKTGELVAKSQDQAYKKNIDFITD